MPTSIKLELPAESLEDMSHLFLIIDTAPKEGI
jgi:hypothetical protein